MSFELSSLSEIQKNDLQTLKLYKMMNKENLYFYHQ